jgi:hypothetical protein
MFYIIKKRSQKIKFCDEFLFLIKTISLEESPLGDSSKWVGQPQGKGG